MSVLGYRSYSVRQGGRKAFLRYCYLVPPKSQVPKSYPLLLDNHGPHYPKNGMVNQMSPVCH